MEKINQEDRGVIVYLDQEGRGTGISGKMTQLDNMLEWKDGKIEQRFEDGKRVDTDKAYKQAGLPSECRDFTVAGEMLNMIGVKSVRLITNNPSKVEGILQAGIGVTRIESHIPPENEIVESDLKSKVENLGHLIPDDKLLIPKDKL